MGYNASRREKSAIYLSELLDDGKFLTAQVEGNEVVYSILLAHARNPLNREEVESRFEGELSRK